MRRKRQFQPRGIHRLPFDLYYFVGFFSHPIRTDKRGNHSIYHVVQKRPDILQIGTGRKSTSNQYYVAFRKLNVLEVRFKVRGGETACVVLIFQTSIYIYVYMHPYTCTHLYMQIMSKCIRLSISIYLSLFLSICLFIQLAN